MKAAQKLRDLSQSLWLDNITRGPLTSGTLRRDVQETSVTGLTSNPTLFDHAIVSDAVATTPQQPGVPSEPTLKEYP